MLFPQDKRNVSDAPSNPPPPPQMQQQPQMQPVYLAPPSGGVKIPILFGAVIALIGACVYLFYQLNQVKTELADTKESFSTEIAKIAEESNLSTQTSRR